VAASPVRRCVIDYSNFSEADFIAEVTMPARLTKLRCRYRGQRDGSHIVSYQSSGLAALGAQKDAGLSDFSNASDEALLRSTGTDTEFTDLGEVTQLMTALSRAPSGRAHRAAAALPSITAAGVIGAADTQQAKESHGEPRQCLAYPTEP
jgi:hypothetical protein